MNSAGADRATYIPSYSAAAAASGKSVEPSTTPSRPAAPKRPQAAASSAEWFRPLIELLPASVATMAGLTLFLTLLFVAMVADVKL